MAWIVPTRSINKSIYAEQLRRPEADSHETFKVQVCTLARNLDPHTVFSLRIDMKDTPKIISAKFKKKFGHSLNTLMVGSDSWEDAAENANGPNRVKKSGCCCSSKRQWLLRHEDWAIEVRMEARQPRRYVLVTL